MAKKYNDYGMLFENVVKKIWGKPNTSIYFAGYYGIKNKEKMILYVLCIYILNYQSPDEELKERIKKFISSEELYLNHSEFAKMLEFLGEKFDL